MFQRIRRRGEIGVEKGGGGEVTEEGAVHETLCFQFYVFDLLDSLVKWSISAS